MKIIGPFLVVVTLTTASAQIDVIGSTVGKAVPQLVTNPVMESSAVSMANTSATMSATITALESQEKIFREAMKKATWARNLETTRRLVVLVEKVICTSRNLNVKLGYFSNSCLWDFQFEINIVKISMASDYLAIVMTEGISMTTGERMDAVNNAVEKFGEAQNELANLNFRLDREIRKREQVAKMNSDIRNYMR